MSPIMPKDVTKMISSLNMNEIIAAIARRMKAALTSLPTESLEWRSSIFETRST